jgi:hypothetical protein
MLIELHDPPTLLAYYCLELMVGMQVGSHTLWLPQHGFGMAYDPLTMLAVEPASSIVAYLV